MAALGVGRLLAANISTMYTECASMLGRFALARKSGFGHVEIQFPYGYPLAELRHAMESACVDVVLINAPPGETNAGDLGISIFPDRMAEFRSSIDDAIAYCHGLGCRKVHVMGGMLSAKDACPESVLRVYRENLLYAADRLEKENILVLIEAVKRSVNGLHYFPGRPSEAAEVVRQLDHQNLKLQLDIFHLQNTEGNLTENIRNLMPITGHVQIAQSPHRGAPGSRGEIDFSYVLGLLADAGYRGAIGLEYVPDGPTDASLTWLRQQGYL